VLLHTKIGLVAAYETCEILSTFKSKCGVRIWSITDQGKWGKQCAKIQRGIVNFLARKTMDYAGDQTFLSNEESLQAS